MGLDQPGQGAERVLDTAQPGQGIGDTEQHDSLSGLQCVGLQERGQCGRMPLALLLHGSQQIMGGEDVGRQPDELIGLRRSLLEPTRAHEQTCQAGAGSGVGGVELYGGAQVIDRLADMAGLLPGLGAEQPCRVIVGCRGHGLVEPPQGGAEVTLEPPCVAQPGEGRRMTGRDQQSGLEGGGGSGRILGLDGGEAAIHGLAEGTRLGGCDARSRQEHRQRD